MNIINLAQVPYWVQMMLTFQHAANSQSGTCQFLHFASVLF